MKEKENDVWSKKKKNVKLRKERKLEWKQSKRKKENIQYSTLTEIRLSLYLETSSNQRWKRKKLFQVK